MHFLMHLKKKSTAINTSTLSSGRVRRTRCQVSEDADAPVAPILTRPLIHKTEQMLETQVSYVVKEPFDMIHSEVDF